MSDKSVQNSALIVTVVSNFVTPLMGSSVNIALPSVGADFAMNAVLLSWVATAYSLAAAVGLLPAGRLADIHGRKKIYVTGMFIFTCACLLAGLAPSSGFLIASRVLQGLGASMIFSTGNAIITSVFGPGERGRALGISVCAVYMGLSVGPFVGGIMTQHFTWRSIFFLVVPLGSIALFLAKTKLKAEWAEAKGQRFDLKGSVLYGLALVCLMQGISLLPEIMGMALIGLGILGLAGFVVCEQRVESPIFEISLFTTNRVFAFSSAASLIHYGATFSMTFLMSLYLQNIKGFSPQDAGLILVAQPGVMALLSPLAGRLSDTIQPRVVASIGMAITSLGLFLFSSISQDTSLRFIVASLCLVGVGYALFSSPNVNAIMSSVETRLLGIAAGSVATSRIMGQMLSLGIATCLFALFLGRVQITPAHYPALIKSLRAAYAIFAVLCAIGILTSLARGKLPVSQRSAKAAKK